MLTQQMCAENLRPAENTLIYTVTVFKGVVVGVHVWPQLATAVYVGHGCGGHSR